MRISKPTIILGLVLGLSLISPNSTTILSSKTPQKAPNAAKRAITADITPPASATTPAATPPPASVTPAPTPEPVAAPAPELNSHQSLMQAAGIAESDWGAVEYIVQHESSWSQAATEPVTGAHGLVQALPFGKTGCGWDDAVCTLAWGDTYAKARYGGWWPAQAYWAAHRNW